MILSRSLKNVCSLEKFYKIIPEYQSALKKSGYKEKLTYLKHEQKTPPKKRNLLRKII